MFVSFFTVCAALTGYLAFAGSSAQAREQAENKPKNGMQVPKPQKSIVLNFPTNVSIGTFIFLTNSGEFKQVPARGQMIVPSNPGTKLKVNYQTGLNLSPLKAIAPDALEELDLAKLEITSEQLQNIKHLSGLKRLDLGETDVDDRALNFLSSLQNLTTLDLRSSCVTARGLPLLSTLKSLEDLNLTNNNIGDLGVAALHGLKNLHRLRLSQCRITDKGLAELASLGALISLDLERNNRVTDKGISSLAQLKHLEHLDLAHTSVSARSLQYLQQLPSLKVLIFSPNNINPAELEEMRKKLPHCKFQSDLDYRHVDVNLYQPLK
jgi:hypothetical protein